MTKEENKQQIDDLQNTFNNFFEAWKKTAFCQLVNEEGHLSLIGVKNENSINYYELSLDGLAEAISDNNVYVFLCNNSIYGFATLTKIFQEISNGNVILLLDVTYNKENNK